MSSLAKWLIGLSIAWVLLTVVTGVCEMVFADTAGISSKFATLLSPTWSLEGMKTMAETIWSMFMWDYPFLKEGIYVFVRYIGLAISWVIGFILVYEIAMAIANAVGGMMGRLLRTGK